MFRLFSLLAGIVLIAAGFALAVVDGARSIADGRLALTTLRALSDLAKAGFVDGLKAPVEHLFPKLWDPVLVSLLSAPAFVYLWGIGFVLYLISRRPPQKIGYSSRG